MVDLNHNKYRMADKYYDMGAMQAFYDKIKTIFQTVANKVTSWSTTPSDDKYPSEKLVKDSLDEISTNARTIPQDISKGANLVVNGSGRMSFNYNFSGFLYIPTIANGGSAGSFGFSATTAEDEYISCDFNKKIVFSADIKNLVAQPSNCVHRIYVAEYDIDKKIINATNVTFGVGTLTELTQDLNPGDTVVHFADLSGAKWIATEAYQRGFIFWNYTNSYGYQYPPETYSRNVYIGAGSTALYENANVDVSAGTITLDSGWTGPAIPAGTKVSRRNSGNTYPYPAQITTGDTEWHSLKGYVKGIVAPGTSERVSTKFSQGTAFIKVGMYPTSLTNSDPVTGKRAVVTNFFVYEEQDISDGFGTLPVDRGGTGATIAIAAEYNILNQVADIDTTLDDDRKIALCNQTKSATNGVFRWIKLSNIWTYIKSKLSSDSTVSIDAYNDIGGRNLLSNTKISATHFTRVDNTASYKGAAFTFDGTDADSFFSLGFLESIATGEKVTFSCDISGLNEANDEYISFSLAALTPNILYTINENGHVAFVITRTNTSEIVPGTTSLTIDDSPRFASTAPSGFTISNIKLERGAVSTSYTKHPAEDPKGVYYVTGSSDYVAYSASSTYTATTSSGPFTSENSCTYGGIAYFCNTAITTPEAWTSAHWTVIATPVLTGTIDGLTSLYAGLKIAYKMSIRGGTSSTYLNINNLGNKYIRRNDSSFTTHLPANTVVFLAYDGTYWRWADYDSNTNNWVTTMGAYCETAAATQAKTATSTNTVYTAGEAFLIRIVNANTYNGKITLNINSQGAKDIWINGAVSSSSNKTLPAGEHWCYYDGSVFHIWTDGTAQFKKVKAESFIGNLSGTATAAAGYTNDGAIATALGNKQDDLGISSSGDTTKFLNEKGQWATPAGTGAKEKSYYSSGSWRGVKFATTTVTSNDATSYGVFQFTRLQIGTGIKTLSGSADKPIVGIVQIFHRTNGSGETVAGNVMARITVFQSDFTGEIRVYYKINGTSVDWYIATTTTRTYVGWRTLKLFSYGTVNDIDLSGVNDVSALTENNASYKTPLIAAASTGTGSETNPVYVDANGRLAACSNYDLSASAVTTSYQSGAPFSPEKGEMVTTESAFDIEFSEMILNKPYRVWGGNKGAVVTNDTSSNVTVYSPGLASWTLGKNGSGKLSTHSSTNLHAVCALLVKTSSTSLVYVRGY